MEKTVVFYHGDACPDGFGAAYAAWKKFGESAEYHPLSRGEEPPVELARGREVYMLDFTYPKEIMAQFVGAAKRMVALDHHEGIREATESVPEHVFDNNRSGAGIAWDYFHPGMPRPALINHVEDDDIFRFALPDTEAVITYLQTEPFDFEVWDNLCRKIDDPKEKEQLLTKARAYREYFEYLARISVERAHLISFEG
ncbi:hypothetical protein L0Y34_00425, partial [Candidatus Parcubacteria bacterium]|nr:hypothetical protein [Candidatus Parcubacteria bacterium]